MVQCTGEAKYISDEDSATMCYAAFALTEKGNAEIVKVDVADALTVPGVIKVVVAMDIPGMNNFAPAPAAAEELLASKSALYAGQPIAIVVASKSWVK